MRATIPVLVLLSLVPRASVAALQGEPVFQASGLREYVQEVLASNAGYRAANSRLAAAGERIAPAGALPDPILTTGVMAVPIPSFDFTTERMTRVPLGLRQSFPFPGKQGAQTAVARADSVLQHQHVRLAETDLAAVAAAAWFELAEANAALEVWQRRVVLADQAVAVAQARYATGQAEQTDVLRARLRRAELEEEQSRLAADQVAATAHLDALRGGTSPSPPVTPTPLLRSDGGAAVGGDADSLLPESALVEQVDRASPVLRAAAAEVERAQRQAHVFAIAARPDFTVTIENGIRSGGREPFLTALVGISVPLWAGRKQKPAARAARLEAEAAVQRYDDIRVRLVGDLRAALAHLRALQARIRQTSDEIIPLAAAASGSALQRYQVGAVEFAAVLDTQDDVFRTQLKLARLIADYGTTRAQLAALVGEEWYK